MNTLQSICETGYVCGLQTIGEAVCNWEIHAVPCMPYAEIPAAVRKVREAIDGIDLDQKVAAYLGAETCARLDAELDKFFTDNA